MKTSGVYLLENETRGKIYIGSSQNIESRIQHHFTLLRNNRHEIPALQDDYNKGDQITYRVIKTLNTNNRAFLLDEESKSIHEYLKDGKQLYNRNYMDNTHSFKTRLDLERQILDLFSFEHFGMCFNLFMARKTPAQIQMYYEIITDPDNEESIREKYSDIIAYQTRERYINERILKGV